LNKESIKKTFQRIGILGGTFDPIHLGHISPALENARWLSLDQLFLLPAHIPPHKKQTVADAKHRQSMVELVCQEFPIFQLDTRELLKNSPSYTVESIEDISEQYKNSQLFFIIGMDSLLTFTSWHRWENILKYCHIVVNTRPEYDLKKLSRICHHSLSQYFIDNMSELNSTQSGKIIFHQHANIDISSTDIRQQLNAKIFDENKLSSGVIKYIKQHQLYR
jgi:nicotinate-nucleotide adenylyltransferase